MDFYALLQAPAFWFDIICAVVLVLFCARYIKIGLLAALVQISGTILSLIGAHLFASAADTWVYEFFFERPLTDQVETLISESGSNGIEALSETMLSVLPEGVQSLFPDMYTGVVQAEFAGTTQEIAQMIMDSTVSLIITQMIFMVLFFFGFVVCRMLVVVLVNLLKAVNNLPVLGSVNRVFGWVFGTIGGTIDFYLVLCVLWLLMLLTGDTLPVLNTTELANSWFFEVFRQYNPFL